MNLRMDMKIEAVSDIDVLKELIPPASLAKIRKRLVEACAEDREAWVKVSFRCKGGKIQEGVAVALEEKVS